MGLGCRIIALMELDDGQKLQSVGDAASFFVALEERKRLLKKRPRLVKITLTPDKPPCCIQGPCLRMIGCQAAFFKRLCQPHSSLADIAAEIPKTLESGRQSQRPLSIAAGN